MTTEMVSDEGEGVYVMEDTLVYLVLSLLLCGLSGITALNQSGDSAKNSSWENSPKQTQKSFFLKYFRLRQSYKVYSVSLDRAERELIGI